MEPFNSQERLPDPTRVPSFACQLILNSPPRPRDDGRTVTTPTLSDSEVQTDLRILSSHRNPKVLKITDRRLIVRNQDYLSLPLFHGGQHSSGEVPSSTEQ